MLLDIVQPVSQLTSVDPEPTPPVMEERTPAQPKLPKKSVTFVCDANLVSVRLIPARPRPLFETDSESGTSESSAEEEEDEEESTESSDSSEEDVAEKMSKLVITRSKRSMAPRRPAKPHVTTMPTHPSKIKRNTNRQKRKQTGITAMQNTIAAKTEDIREQWVKRRTGLMSTKKFGRAVQRRPNSGDRDRGLPTNPSLIRYTASAPTIRTSPGDDSRLLRLRKGMDFYHIAPRNDVFRLQRTSGQERTKEYAWEIANGAPLVTTPSIAPLYGTGEALTVTTLPKL